MNYRHHHFLPLAFAAVVLFYWADYTFRLTPYRPAVENRVPASRPDFRPDYLDPFPRDYEAFFNDAFYWKGRFQAFNARLQGLTKARSPLPDLVAIGKNDWFFKGGLQMDIYRGKERFSPEELREVVATLQSRRDSVESLGGKYYLAVAPLKHHVYAHQLPDHVRQLNAEYAVRQLYTALEVAGVNHVDLHAHLRTLDPAATPLYYRTDHHWTVQAGLHAAVALVDRFRADGFPLSPIDTADYYFSGSPAKGMLLAKLAGRQREEQETFHVLRRHGPWATELLPRTDRPAPVGFPYPESYFRQRIQTDPATLRQLPSLFVTHESFGQNILLPLSNQFGRSSWLFDEWRHDLNLPVYREEGGDVYLQLIWEGFLFNLLAVPVEDGKW